MTRCEHCVTTDRPKNGDECPFMAYLDAREKAQHDQMSKRLSGPQL